MICTGTFYEEWYDEPKKFNFSNVISGLCVILGIYFTSRVLYTKHKAKRVIQVVAKVQKKEKTNFGANSRTWMVTAMVWIGVFSLAKFNS